MAANIMWWPLAPIGFASQSYLLRRKAARYYMSPGRDAVLAIVATDKGWSIQDHMAAKPGAKQGKVLRSRILPELRAAADGGGIRIYTTAANERLAAQYAAELPGLVVVGRGWPRGLKMVREPQKAPSES